MLESRHSIRNSQRVDWVHFPPMMNFHRKPIVAGQVIDLSGFSSKVICFASALTGLMLETIAPSAAYTLYWADSTNTASLNPGPASGVYRSIATSRSGLPPGTYFERTISGITTSNTNLITFSESNGQSTGQGYRVDFPTSTNGATSYNYVGAQGNFSACSGNPGQTTCLASTGGPGYAGTPNTSRYMFVTNGQSVAIELGNQAWVPNNRVVAPPTNYFGLLWGGNGPNGTDTSGLGAPNSTDTITFTFSDRAISFYEVECWKSSHSGFSSAPICNP